MSFIESQSVVSLCTLHGFALAGITAAKRSTHDTTFQQWLRDGKHGEMEWLNRNVEVRLDPTILVDGARSVICVADRYGNCEDQELGVHDGRIARYARGEDYHKVMKRRLHEISDELKDRYPDDIFRTCVDTAPLFEREHAASAGLGSIGKHTLLIEQGVGSWLLLGAIVTTADITPTQSEQSDPCATCTSCIDACPTDAITPWNVDATKCISYLTIEHRSVIDPTFFHAIDRWIFGCDICQEVCPHNQLTERTAAAPVNHAYQPEVETLDVLEVLDWDEQARRDTFRGASLKRAKLGMIKRNALIVAGNIIARSGNVELLCKLKQIAHEDDDPLLQQTADAVLQQLKIDS